MPASRRVAHTSVWHTEVAHVAKLRGHRSVSPAHIRRPFELEDAKQHRRQGAFVCHGQVAQVPSVRKREVYTVQAPEAMKGFRPFVCVEYRRSSCLRHPIVTNSRFAKPKQTPQVLNVCNAWKQRNDELNADVLFAWESTDEVDELRNLEQLLFEGRRGIR